MSNSEFNEIEEDEIDLRELFSSIFKYKYSIITITLIVTLLAYIFQYYKPNIYKLNTTIEVSSKKAPSFNGNDLLMDAFNQGSSDLDTEMAILKSRYVTSLALKSVNETDRYYSIGNKIESNSSKSLIKYLKPSYYLSKFKKSELGKKSPFKVEVKSGYGIPFIIEPIDENSFLLEVKDSKDKNGNKWSYKSKHNYNEWITNKHFLIKVKKIKKPLYKKYIAIINDTVTTEENIIKKLNVAQLNKGASVIKIEIEDNLPYRAKEFLNSLTKAYLEQSIEQKTKIATLKLQFIDKQLKIITNSLKEVSNDLEKFNRKSKSVNLSSKSEETLKRSAEFKAELEKILLKKSMLISIFKQIKSGKSLDTIAVAGLDADSLTISNMVSQLQKAIIERRALSSKYTNTHPQMKRLASTINQLKQTILQTLNSTLKQIKTRESFIRRSLKKEQAIIDALPKSERIYTTLKRNYMFNEKIYTYLLEKRYEVAFAKAATISKNRVIDSAVIPKEPVKPKRMLIILVGLILGLILGIMQAFIRNFLRDKIETKEDITKLTNVPVVSTIPHVDNLKDREITVIKDPKSTISEAFRALRVNLRYLIGAKDRVTIAVTSTLPKEGKTFTSTNLAAMMALTDKSVIIINMDLRKPTLHKHFNLSNKYGVSSYLVGEKEIKDIIQSTDIKNLNVITSGPIPPNPGELIESEMFENMIKYLQEHYDIVIVDTPPVGIVAETKHVLEVSDVVLYVMRANYSKKEFIKVVEDIKELKKKGGMAIVLNDLTASKKGYGYGYGYGYNY